MKKCPSCAEEIQSDAIKCKHCGEILKKPFRMGCGTFLGGCILLLFIIGLIGSLGGNSTNNSGSQNNESEALKVNDRVVIVDKEKQLVGYTEGNIFSSNFKSIRIPDSEVVANGQMGTVEEVGCQYEQPIIQYYTDGTQKVVDHSCSGDKTYTVMLDNGNEARITDGGLRKETGPNNQTATVNSQSAQDSSENQVKTTDTDRQYNEPASQATSDNTQTDDLTNSYTVNVPNSQGGYTAIVITKSGDGYKGPRGEYYSEFPTVAQLQFAYGVN